MSSTEEKNYSVMMWLMVSMETAVVIMKLLT